MKRSKTERAAVNKLIASLRRNSPDAYIYVDRDSGAVRHTLSGWDFLVAMGNRVAFVEAKMGNRPLSNWQELTRAIAQRAQCRYLVLRFTDDGESFTLSHSMRVFDTDKVIAENFLGM